MNEEFTSLGLMSGTSGDGVDASIIKSDGKTKYEVIKDEYFEYDESIYQKIHVLKDKIHNLDGLNKFKKELSNLEREITLFHATVAKKILIGKKIDFVGFHGHTVYHNPSEKISKQIGNGSLLSKLLKQKVIFNFRQNDIKNGGEGAPLTPIFHQILAIQKKIKLPLCILNIGGISNITIIDKLIGTSQNLKSKDIGPGNCLIDKWVRKNSKQKFDRDGILASRGIRNEIILEQAQELFSNRKNQDINTFDVNDFDVSFARGLSLEDGVATLTDFTGNIVGKVLNSILLKESDKDWKILLCGGGRKNKVLIDIIRKNCSKKYTIESIDNYAVNGDFIESQAFAFLAIRSFLNLPISFPNTTRCIKPSTGGEIIEFK